ncbi:MAG: DUF4097 family beta strand repeat-containing protein [Phycisphaerae bacterium]
MFTRRSGIVLIALPLVALSGCSALVTAKRDYSLTSPWSGYERVLVKSVNGSIDVSVATTPEVRITGVTRAGGATFEEAEHNVDQVQVVAKADPSSARTLLVSVEYPESLRGKSVGANIKVELPQPAAAELTSSNGSISAGGTRGVIARTSNGAITLRDIAGGGEARTSNGGVEAERVSGPLTIESGNANIVARNIVGDLTVETSNGRVDVSDIRGNLRVRTSNGSIRAAARPKPDGVIELQTSNGSITAGVPEDVRGIVSLATSNGSVKPNLGPVKFSVVKWSARDFEAELNGGGSGRFTASTSNGSIELTSFAARNE